MRTRSPVVGGQFAAWGGLFSAIDCSLVAIRRKVCCLCLLYATISVHLESCDVLNSCAFLRKLHFEPLFLPTFPGVSNVSLPLLSHCELTPPFASDFLQQFIVSASFTVLPKF